MNTQTPLQRAAQAAGSQAKLAGLIGVNRSFIAQLVSGHRPMPQAVCAKIEAATGVLCEELRPDVQWVRRRGRVVAYLVPVP